MQRAVETRDARGSIETSWEDVATIWAAVEALTGREFFESAQVNPELTSKVVVRHRTDIQPKMRIVHGERVFDVAQVADPEGRGRTLELMVSEVVAS